MASNHNQHHAGISPSFEHATGSSTNITTRFTRRDIEKNVVVMVTESITDDLLSSRTHNNHHQRTAG
ncbi:hypothetical protein T265_05209 [Opisthorchis viverrini]|uniref:Uncharacterized protein n=1 Tax=Opisthorchis viverrini TaxID=6198 RepID=A0A074ZLA4_OPIVI|nr:hypothetical protein T265_05209 [Opisthorchis viverrini]KER27856.1 hypothetical protein T265_05209 [Opisthorchis viverrini]